MQQYVYLVWYGNYSFYPSHEHYLLWVFFFFFTFSFSSEASIEESRVEWELITVINLLALLVLNEAHSCGYSYLSTHY